MKPNKLCISKLHNMLNKKIKKHIQILINRILISFIKLFLPERYPWLK